MNEQINTILTNMREYARVNKCDFIETYDTNTQRTAIYLNEHGFTLNFVVCWNYKNVLVDNELIKFEEFIKFQENFLK